MLDYTGPNQTWAAALKRAGEANIRVWQRLSDLRDYFIFETTSSEEPALPVYTVAVKADLDGIHISCDCLAGTNGRICRHAAKVLNLMGHLKSSEGDEPAPEPTPLRQPAAQLSVAEINGLLFGEL